MAPRRTLLAYLLVVGVFFALLAYSMASAPIKLSEDDQVLVRRHNSLGFEILKELAGSEENVVISPTSISLALGMVYNGARGETREAITQTMRITNMSIEDVNKASKNIITFLNRPDPDVGLSVANSIWAKLNITFREEFIDTNRKYFDAQVETLDFTAPDAVETINNWVSKKTKKNIPEVLEMIDPLDVMFVINAIYFKGTWTKRFDKKLTQDGEFTLIDGTKRKVPMMRWKESQDARHLCTEGFEAVELPYGDRERISMYIFVPRNITDFVACLNTSKWEGWMEQFQENKVWLEMPRFKVEYETRLNQALTALGMGIAFDQHLANFTGIAEPAELPEGVHIAYVTHKTLCEVDEEGTRAAGGTLFTVRTLSGPTTIKVNKPFFFAIRDNQSGAILFMGKIQDPAS